jgi:hypothetical protein
MRKEKEIGKKSDIKRREVRERAQGIANTPAEEGVGKKERDP